MRGDERVQDEMFSCVTLEQRVPQDHPLREIRKLVDVVLVSLNDEFDALYSVAGRPSIAPEYVLRALLLQVFHSICSERQLVAQLDYNLLFRCFVGLGMDDSVWNHAVFSKNRYRLLTSVVLLIIWRTSVLIMWHTSAYGRALRNSACFSRCRAAAFRAVASAFGRAETAACRCIRGLDSLSNGLEVGEWIP